jgi:DNA-directed RNA polymerase subunit RPC12/RpoP
LESLGLFEISPGNLVPAAPGAKVRAKTVRILVEPPSSSRCPACGGVLLFKMFRAAKFAFDSDSEIFVCEQCGREHRHVLRPSSRASAASRMEPS